MDITAATGEEETNDSGRKIRKQAYIDAYRQDMGGAVEQASSESMTVQYLECEHGCVWVSENMSNTMHPRCERPKCVRWIRMYKDGVMPTEAAEAPEYNAAGSNGTSMDGPVNHTESGGTGENDGVDMGGKTCEICDEEADGKC